MIQAKSLHFSVENINVVFPINIHNFLHSKNEVPATKKEGDVNLETNKMKAINKDNKNNVEERFTNVEKKIDEILIKINNNYLKESKSSYAQVMKKQATTIGGETRKVKRANAIW